MHHFLAHCDAVGEGGNHPIWYRREIGLTAARAKAMATVSLGLLDDVGRVWINGKPVG